MAKKLYEEHIPKKNLAYRGLKNLFRAYTRRCMQRNIYFDLTIEEFNAITKKLCVYCEKPPSMKVGGYIYNSIDRIDPKGGYFYANSAPCCKECNALKSNLLSFEEMKVVAQALRAFRKTKG